MPASDCGTGPGLGTGHAEGGDPCARHIDLGQEIRDRRQELGLKQAEVAMQGGVTTPTISTIENGKKTARIGLALQICRDLGLRIRIET